MKITHVVENLNRGGLERAVIDLICAQRARGHDCQLICLFERGTLAEELEGHGVPVHACEKRRGFDTAAIGRLRRHLRDHASEILHTHNAVAHYHAVLAALGLPIRRTINTRHGMGGLATGSRREWIYRRSLMRTDAVVTVCESARRDMLERDAAPESKLVAIPNGIRVERFDPSDEPSRANLAASLGLPAGTRLIGTVGRLNWAKDQSSLIAAFARVHERIGDTALVVVGDGELRAGLREIADKSAAAGRILFLGDRNDVDELLRGFSLFAMSSLTEGYSIALLEACAAGLPIVATDVGGNAEIVREDINGLLVPARSEDALAEAMIDLLSDPQRMAAMGKAGRDWVLEEGSFTTMAARYDAVYAGHQIGD
ncbi:glycosyltransferase [Dokdonella sp.]|uniref:glycosyltransferase n=1 Tax=Dokdonella sp. TaxID=2291710 RepID=UPI00352898C4